MTEEKITLAAGCFWCYEAVFQRIRGVISVQSGYSGGEMESPSYEQVCNGDTGHAEAVQITFNPQIISLEKLLEVFWYVHDPTTLNRQGNDVGTQYRSAIFYHTDEQKKIANESKNAAQAYFEDPIVTEITAYNNFFAAEEYHNNYYNNNSSQGYCQFVINPKLEKFSAKFKDILKK